MTANGQKAALRLKISQAVKAYLEHLVTLPPKTPIDRKKIRELVVAVVGPRPRRGVVTFWVRYAALLRPAYRRAYLVEARAVGLVNRLKAEVTAQQEVRP